MVLTSSHFLQRVQPHFPILIVKRRWLLWHFIQYITQCFLYLRGSLQSYKEKSRVTAWGSLSDNRHSKLKILPVPHSVGFPDSSVGKESTQKVGDPGSIPGSGRSSGEPGDRLPPSVFLGFPWGSAGKESTCNAGDLGSIPGLGRSPREGKGYPLQYSGLENSMDYRLYSPWGRKESETTFTFTTQPEIWGTGSRTQHVILREVQCQSHTIDESPGWSSTSLNDIFSGIFFSP